MVSIVSLSVDQHGLLIVVKFYTVTPTLSFLLAILRPESRKHSYPISPFLLAGWSELVLQRSHVTDNRASLGINDRGSVLLRLSNRLNHATSPA